MIFQTEKLFTESKIKYNLPEAEIDYFSGIFLPGKVSPFPNSVT
jgi:hypothetical protein